MIDYHAEQFDPKTACSGFDCACATTAIDIYFGTRGAVVMDHADVRIASHVSCVPRKDTPSGGLDVSAIEDVCKSKGVDIDFRGRTTSLRRWTSTEVGTRLGTFWSGHLLGMYSSVPQPWRADTSFRGGHSVFAHDLREDKSDSHFGKVQATVCWHDPLRKRPIRVPWSVVEHYTQADTPFRGFAGWVRIPLPDGWTYAKPMLDRTRTDFPTVAVHRDRTKGEASTTRIIRGVGTLVELAVYAEGESYKGETTWGCLDLLGREWINLGRLDHVGGAT